MQSGASQLSFKLLLYFLVELKKKFYFSIFNNWGSLQNWSLNVDTHNKARIQQQESAL